MFKCSVNVFKSYVRVYRRIGSDDVGEIFYQSSDGMKLCSMTHSHRIDGFRVQAKPVNWGIFMGKVLVDVRLSYEIKIGNTISYVSEGLLIFNDVVIEGNVVTKSKPVEVYSPLPIEKGIVVSNKFEWQGKTIDLSKY